MDQRPDAVDDRPVDGGRRDLLVEHREDVAACLFLLAVALLVASLATGVRSDLPSVALNWKFGLDIARAAVAFAFITAVVLLLVRGWGGIWPSRLSTTGIDFDRLSEGSQDIARGTQEVIGIMQQLIRTEIAAEFDRREQ